MALYVAVGVSDLAGAGFGGGAVYQPRFACGFVGRAASIAAVESGASAGRTVSAFYFARGQLCG
ncbi:Uncharacterised protein [Vibrio cholerae]|nr:Uncharacterised protein [Vibrio cholerae]CSI56364.1 Uncharacterised protein [Vibrio cholerae]